MLEAKAIGEHIGIPIDQQPEDRHAVTRKLGAFKTSMLQDVEAGKPVELDALGDGRARAGPTHGRGNAIHRCLVGPEPLAGTDTGALSQLKVSCDLRRGGAWGLKWSYPPSAGNNFISPVAITSTASAASIKPMSRVMTLMPVWPRKREIGSASVKHTAVASAITTP